MGYRRAIKVQKLGWRLLSRSRLLCFGLWHHQQKGILCLSLSLLTTSNLGSKSFWTRVHQRNLKNSHSFWWATRSTELTNDKSKKSQWLTFWQSIQKSSICRQVPRTAREFQLLLKWSHWLQLRTSSKKCNCLANEDSFQWK